MLQGPPGGRGAALSHAHHPPRAHPRPNSPKCLICFSYFSTKVLCFCSLTSSDSSSACSGLVLTMLCGEARRGVGWGEAAAAGRLERGRVGRGRNAHPIHSGGGDGAVHISVAGAWACQVWPRTGAFGQIRGRGTGGVPHCRGPRPTPRPLLDLRSAPRPRPLPVTPRPRPPC